MPLSDASHLSSSPSLTSLVDSAPSSSVPSPNESVQVIEPQRIKSEFPFDSGCIRQPSIRRMSALDTLAHPPHFSFIPPSSPGYRHPNNQDPSLKSWFSKTQKRQYQPYTPQSGNVLPGLLYAARSFGISSPTDLTVDGVEEVCHIIVSINYLTCKLEQGYLCQCTFRDA